jgi:hypothetical protein
MAEMKIYSSVPGILRPFREFLEKKGVKAGDQIVYYGVPGTCTPFVELLAFAVRKMGISQIFVPFFEEKNGREIIEVPKVGMQTAGPGKIERPKAVIIMGGLSMPDVPVKVADAKSAIAKYPEAQRIGICFMHMFEKAGWTKEIHFDLLIDAMIDPVEVSEGSG